MNYINRVISAIYDTGIVANQFALAEESLLVSVALCPEQKPQPLLLNFDDESNTLNIVGQLSAWFTTDSPCVSVLMYIALETANGAIHDIHAPGRVLLNLSEEHSAQFMFSASFPYLLLPQEVASLVKRAAEAAIAVRPHLSRFAQHSNQGIISIEDALNDTSVLEPQGAQQIRVSLHPALIILSDTDTSVSSDGENE